MSPVDKKSHEQVEQQLKDIIQDLYQVMVGVTTYNAAGRDTIHTLASSPHSTLPSVPPELLEYVENGRNPDIYTREFVELVRHGNQLIRSKTTAFGAMTDILAGDMSLALPELRGDMARVLEATGRGGPLGAAERRNGEAWRTGRHGGRFL
ncbi:mediator of RNA polymerase II transcription subunit 10 [Ophiocordyceps sinensis CO18]|uniref:Mediator of RNA polymerase II transcription subunit 10 n=1 Tax=Ophiocordyceps sinensis (strain Co18 / CGMCC 3.14243) TaxID=911162 RepID=T5ACF0_OPHSC|nr:mediator of RNA polymerase II transcription subunit 10 [Ophiocordyceps sinensis CO18]